MIPDPEPEPTPPEPDEYDVLSGETPVAADEKHGWVLSKGVEPAPAPAPSPPRPYNERPRFSNDDAFAMWRQAEVYATRIRPNLDALAVQVREMLKKARDEKAPSTDDPDVYYVNSVPLKLTVRHPDPRRTEFGGSLEVRDTRDRERGAVPALNLYISVASYGYRSTDTPFFSLCMDLEVRLDGLMLKREVARTLPFDGLNPLPSGDVNDTLLRFGLALNGNARAALADYP